MHDIDPTNLFLGSEDQPTLGITKIQPHIIFQDTINANKLCKTGSYINYRLQESVGQANPGISCPKSSKLSGLSFSDLLTGGVDGGDNACLTPATKLDATRGSADAGGAGSLTGGAGSLTGAAGALTGGAGALTGGNANRQGESKSVCKPGFETLGAKLVVCRACSR